MPEEAEKTWRVYRYKIPKQDLTPLLSSLETGLVNGEWYISLLQRKKRPTFCSPQR